MVVRIIYRPSHPGVMAPPRPAGGRSPLSLGLADYPSEVNAREPEPAPKPAPSYSGVLRSVALFLVRLGLGALIMAAWRIAVDLGLPVPFIIPSGIFSHWQVWFGAAVLLLAGAGLVARRLEFGRAREERSADREQAA
ncbi:MAG: hypothetical protein P4K98_02920 [Bryobacteraceae bacterium]|nr:hypothetical protein [Bryobacteraceae bacterium]